MFIVSPSLVQVMLLQAPTIRSLSLKLSAGSGEKPETTGIDTNRRKDNKINLFIYGTSYHISSAIQAMTDNIPATAIIAR